MCLSLVLGLAIIPVAFPVPVTAQSCIDLIVNGGFETVGGWELGPNPVTPQYVTFTQAQRQPIAHVGHHQRRQRPELLFGASDGDHPGHGNADNPVVLVLRHGELRPRRPTTWK